MILLMVKRLSRRLRKCSIALPPFLALTTLRTIWCGDAHTHTMTHCPKTVHLIIYMWWCVIHGSDTPAANPCLFSSSCATLPEHGCPNTRYRHWHQRVWTVGTTLSGLCESMPLALNWPLAEADHQMILQKCSDKSCIKQESHPHDEGCCNFSFIETDRDELQKITVPFYSLSIICISIWAGAWHFVGID